MKLLWEEKAWEDYCNWQQTDKKVAKRINIIIKDIQRNTFSGLGKPEPLKNNYSGDPTSGSVEIDRFKNLCTCPSVRQRNTPPFEQQFAESILCRINFIYQSLPFIIVKIHSN